MRPRDVLEWVVLGISVLAISAVTLVLVVEALGETTQADPQVELHEAEGRQGSLGWIIPVTVTNSGDESVEGVVLEATAQVDGAEETSQIDLPFLPAQTEIDAEIAFSSRPDGAITVRLLGHRLP
jgi:uncharacterized protein (TIGR02588 family)